MTSTEIVAALAKRHPAPVWAFIEQVRSGTGWAKEPRTADALAMSCWPSRGLELHGFEVKVNRGDWTRELKDPAKAEEIMGFCDRWWIVTPAAGVVNEGEIPSTWGHMVVNGPAPRGVTVKIAAPKLKAKPIDRLFLAAILRKVNECSIPVDRIKDQLEAARKESEQRGAASAKYEIEQLRLLETHVVAFETASGVGIRHAYQHGRIGEAVRRVLETGPMHVRKEMELHRSWLKGRLAEAEAYLQDTDADGTDTSGGKGT